MAFIPRNVMRPSSLKEVIIAVIWLSGAVHKICRLGRGGVGSPKDDLLHRPYLIKSRHGGRGSKIANFETK